MAYLVSILCPYDDGRDLNPAVDSFARSMRVAFKALGALPAVFVCDALTDTHTRDTSD